MISKSGKVPQFEKTQFSIILVMPLVSVLNNLNSVHSGCKTKTKNSYEDSYQCNKRLLISLRYLYRTF